jgi:hypothetical protein
MSNDDWWGPTFLAVLALGDTLSAKQQIRFVKNLRGLAKLRAEKGDFVTADFLHALANDDPQDTEQPPRQKPVLRLVQ